VQGCHMAKLLNFAQILYQCTPSRHTTERIFNSQ
jgi:hypothetical protein